MTPILNEIAYRQGDIVTDLLADLVDDRSEIPACNVRLDDDSSLDILAVDSIGSLVDLDRRHLADGNLGAKRSID